LRFLKSHPALPTCSQKRAAAEQLYISRGCLRNILRNEKALRSEASLLEGSDWRRQRQGNDQEVEEGFSNF